MRKTPSACIALLTFLVTFETLAYRPEGWVYGQFPYLFDQSSGSWVYMEPVGNAYAYDTSQSRWQRFGNSPPARGWSYWMWPYAYSSASGEWFFIDVSSEHWCLTFATGQWSTLGSSTSDSAYAPYERDTHQRINAFRQSRGLPPLIWDDTVADVCREHSQNMADGRVPFSHDGFDGRTDLLFGTFSSARSAAENVAYNQGYPNPPATAVSGWIDSPGHYENIVGNWTHTGIGVARNENNAYYFTQIFLRID